MKVLFSLLLLIHGAIHLMGSAKAFNPTAVSQLALSISKPVGLLYHLLATGNRLRYYFSFSREMQKIRIVYALSTRDSSRENIRAGFDFLKEHAHNCGAKVIETVIVNPCIRTAMMRRHGWEYMGRAKYLWRIFHLPIVSFK